MFDSNVSLEVLNLLILFSKKYSFIKLRRAENNLQNNDLESSFLTSDYSNLTHQLNNSNLCLLVGLNSRYESSSLNIKLRKRYLNGDFRVFSIGSSTDLTFPVSYLGLNTKNLQSLAEGNNFFCQDLANCKPTILVSSNIFQRKDSKSIFEVLKLLKKNIQKTYPQWDSLHIVNSSINEAGVKYLNNFKSLSENDLNSSNGLYFLNTSSQTVNLKKIINIKLLKYVESNDSLPKFCFEQNNGIITTAISKYYKSQYKIYNYLNLPNNVFFETNGTYLNTEGVFKKTVKFISTNKQTKEDWQIIRKILACSKNINFSNNAKDNSIVTFNNNNLNNFKNFTEFLHFATNNIEAKSTIHLNGKIPSSFVNTDDIVKQKKFKIFSTKFKIWINDFYLGGKDQYSKKSSTMINCSKALRAEKHTFTHLN